MKKRNVELKAAISAVDEQTKKMYAKGRLEETASKAASGQVKGRLSPRLVKSLRSKMGLSQGKFAKLLGVSLGSVVNWELGKMNPRPEMRQKMLSFRGMGRREVKLILENL
ncbi:MAG: helix-turn-helix domain-containing protein [Candidatus Hydrogenedentota bacterium]